MKMHLIVQAVSLALALVIVTSTGPCRCTNHNDATDSCTPACCQSHDEATDGCSSPSIVPFNILEDYMD